MNSLPLSVTLLKRPSERETVKLRYENTSFQSVNKPKMLYFEKEDILYVVIADEEEVNSVELTPNITAELNEKGELIGVEILNASTFVRDSILEGVQARILNLSNSGK